MALFDIVDVYVDRACPLTRFTTNTPLITAMQKDKQQIRHSQKAMRTMTCNSAKYPRQAKITKTMLSISVPLRKNRKNNNTISIIGEHAAIR
jgi:hypothetical protein